MNICAYQVCLFIVYLARTIHKTCIVPDIAKSCNPWAEATSDEQVTKKRFVVKPYILKKQNTKNYVIKNKIPTSIWSTSSAVPTPLKTQFISISDQPYTQCQCQPHSFKLNLKCLKVLHSLILSGKNFNITFPSIGSSC